MAKIEAGPARPISPHLTIFRPYVNMMMSILHRITGVANYMGMLLLTAWLVAAAMGPESFESVSAIAGSPIGLIILFGFSWSLLHHALGGIRHFLWDVGYGFDVPTARLLSWGTLVGSVSLTAILWLVGLAKWGVL